MNWVRKQLHRMSLFHHLLILGGVLFVGLLALVTYVTQETTHSLEERVTEERLIGTQVLASSLDEVIRRALLEFEVTGKLIESELAGPHTVRNFLLPVE